MRLIHSAILCLYLSTAAASMAGQQGLGLNYIQGEGNVKGLKIAYLLKSDKLHKYLDKSTLDLELSVNFWTYGNPNQHQTNFVLAVSPIFQYQLGEFNNLPVFGIFGIGVSLFDSTHFAGKNVGSHYQFEDRLGLAIKTGKNLQNLWSLTYFHYSNGGLQKPNPGLDFVALSYSHYY